MSRPWRGPGERVAAWWTVSGPDGPLPGLFLSLPDVDAWVDRHPGVFWRVAFWLSGRLRGVWLVWSRPVDSRGPGETPLWLRDSKAACGRGGGDGGDE
mgnify:CR=1 FL=1